MVFVFFLSALLLASLVLLKLWELKRQKISWFSKTLASQDLKVRSAILSLRLILLSLKDRAKHFLLIFLPVLLGTSFIRFKNFIIENLFRIEDNIRGKYKKFRSSKPTSSYLRKISEVKTESGRTRDPRD